MKSPALRLLLLFFCIPVLVLAQEKGVTPTPSTVYRPSSTVRAVVIGISDYQDPQIPDLQYAHRDAKAFAAWLQSPAGGSVPEENLQVLTNNQAIAGNCIEALTWLLEESREGDLAIIYFAGHGDVERRIVSQPGYLLCWDAPSKVYMAGGTLGTHLIQMVTTTLSQQNKARVLLLFDSAHAGALAGSDIGGTSLTAAHLAMQYANEIKILSCQPNEVSIESEQWGGGRSAFSFRLLEGLYGGADVNGDGQITLDEIRLYLEAHVSAEVVPNSQTPIVIGDRQAVLGATDPDLSAALLRLQAAVPSDANASAPGEQFYQRLESALRDHTGAFDWLTRQPDLTPFREDPRVQLLLQQYKP